MKAVILALGTVPVVVAAVQLKPPPNAEGATPVDQGFIGYGIEMKSFPQYAGLTGAPVHVRVGGTSMDNTVFQPSEGNATTPEGNSEDCHLHNNVTIGSPWLNGFENFKVPIRYTVQVPLARRNLANAAKFASSCIDKMPQKIGQLDAIEIGNEPNLYPKNPSKDCGGPDRKTSYGPADYAEEFSTYAANLSTEVQPLRNAQKGFQSMAFSSNLDQSVWNVPNVWNKITKKGLVRTVSQHYYQAQIGQNPDCSLKRDLLTHSKTVQELNSNFGANMQFLAEKNASFVLGEVGSAIGGNGAQTCPTYYRNLGTALWSVDFLLQAMTMGVKRVSMQLGTNFNIAAWQPVSTKQENRTVNGNYYGHVFAADFIGKTGDFEVKEFDTTVEDLVAYAGYNKRVLTKVAILDLVVPRGSGRPSRNLTLTGLGDGVKSHRISRLTAPGGALAVEGITWAGQEWSVKSNGNPDQVGDRPAVIKKTDSIDILASEAILVEVL